MEAAEFTATRTKRRPLSEPPPARLVVAAMWSPALDRERVFAEITSIFGPPRSWTEPFNFTHSDYYAREMGAGLRKCFVDIEGVQPRDSLVAHKLAAAALEDRFLDSSGRRQLNLDPMLVSRENVCISTSKNFTHRIYLGSGVWGDVALVWREGRFQALPWAYVDYVERLPFFESVRRALIRSAI